MNQVGILGREVGIHDLTIHDGFDAVRPLENGLCHKDFTWVFTLVMVTVVYRR
jgi:hypothetical protein